MPVNLPPSLPARHSAPSSPLSTPTPESPAVGNQARQSVPEKIFQPRPAAWTGRIDYAWPRAKATRAASSTELAPGAHADPQAVQTSASGAQDTPYRASDYDLERVKGVYDQYRLYHGTSDVAKESIREKGFRIDQKSTGATQAVVQTQASRLEPATSASGKARLDTLPLIRDAANHHFVTADKLRAQQFARHAANKRAALTRLIPDRDTHLENDPHATGALRTKDDISAGNVLGSKRALPTQDNAAHRTFQTALAETGIEVSEYLAGQLLNEVQSDSDQDFKPSLRRNRYGARPGRESGDA